MSSILTTDANDEPARLDRMYNNPLNHLKVQWPTDMPQDAQESATTTVRTELGAQSKLALGPQDAQTLVNVFGGNYTPEQRAGWRQESDAELRQLAEFEYRGQVSTAELLADAKRYLAKSPNTAKLLNDLGLQDHPKVVGMAVRQARELKIRGWL